MSITRMREQIVLKKLSITSDGAGGNTSSDTTVGTFWAKVSRLNASNNVEDGRDFLQDSVVFTVRYGEFTISKIDDYTITWDSKVYKINGLDNIGERDKFINLTCSNEN